MKQTSYAVKPELYNKEQEVIELTTIDEVSYEGTNDGYLIFHTNLGELWVGYYEPDIIRLITYHQEFDDERSFPLESLNPILFDEEIQTEDFYQFTWGKTKLTVYRSPFTIVVHQGNTLRFNLRSIGFQNESTYFIVDRHVDDFIYGLGEKTGFLNKNNERTVNWNSDVFEPHTRSNKALYQSINMFIHKRETQQYGLFVDNPSRMTFDFDTQADYGVVITDIGKFDAYIYLGNSLKSIVKQHAIVTGKPYLPPLWAFGYHQSRHSYESTDVVKDVYQSFKDKGIPIDAIYLDILYMDHYKVFTFNPDTYGNIKEVIKELKTDGVRIVPIVDPGVKVEQGYSIYEEGLKDNHYCKDKDGLVFTGEVWPGKSVFYDFYHSKSRQAWGKLHQFYTDLGIEGIWNDMNEPSIFDQKTNTMPDDVYHNVEGKLKSHREVHNLYGLGMSHATYHGLKQLTGKRPFVLTRAGYAGIQSCATVWTGDNRSSWEHLEMTLPMCLNLGLSGVSHCGPDVGGFMDDSFEELMIRWVQLGAFLPFFRNHSSIGMKRQEPWQFGERCEAISRKYIRLRYELIRYIYSEAYKSSLTGLPMMRPLVLEYEDDTMTYGIHDQFLLGSNLLIAPILRPNETHRKVYLPKGIWYDFFTNKKYQGEQWIIVKAELDEIPVFVRGGSVLPLGEAAFNTEQLSREVTLTVYPGEEPINETLYFDDGISLIDETSTLTVHVTENNGQIEWNQLGNMELNFQFEIKPMG